MSSRRPGPPGMAACSHAAPLVWTQNSRAEGSPGLGGRDCRLSWSSSWDSVPVRSAQAGPSSQVLFAVQRRPPDFPARLSSRPRWRHGSHVTFCRNRSRWPLVSVSWLRKKGWQGWGGGGVGVGFESQAKESFGCLQLRPGEIPPEEFPACELPARAKENGCPAVRGGCGHPGAREDGQSGPLYFR